MQTEHANMSSALWTNGFTETSNSVMVYGVSTIFYIHVKCMLTSKFDIGYDHAGMYVEMFAVMTF